VRFARLIHRHVRDLGVPSARAASGGSMSLPWLLLRVVGMTEVIRLVTLVGSSAAFWRSEVPC
jgi:hypothetical protein